MFWTIALLLTLGVMIILVLPFIRQTSQANVIERREQNILLAKQDLLELKQDLADGKVEQAEFEAIKAELERSLHEDLAAAEALLDQQQPATASHTQSRSFMFALLAFVPIAAMGFYAWLGQPEAIRLSSDPSANARERTQQQAKTMDSMIGKLADKLESDPKNLEGWLMLGRSNLAMSRLDAAADAYGKAYALSPEDPDIMITYADALAAKDDSKLTGEPETLILKALAKEPEHRIGLWLAGMAASQRGDDAQAVQYWTKLDGLMTGESEERSRLRDMIVASGGKVNDAAPAKADASKGVTVSITLANDLAAQASPNDVLFIYAKAVSGPPMPLAAVRKKVSDLPLTITLDDSLAMMPQMKISAYPQVVVGARVAKGGTPTAEAGDLFGENSGVALGSEVKLEINQVVK